MMQPQRSAAKGKGVPIRWILLTSMMSLLSFYSGLLVGMGTNNKAEGESSLKVEPPNPLQHLKEKQSRFPERMNKIVSGMSRVDRKDFIETYDIGAPVDKSSTGNEEVLLLYRGKAQPNGPAGDSVKLNDEIPVLGADEATENCSIMKVLLFDSDSGKECLAIMSQYESYHLQKWMRLPEGGGAINLTSPLRHVSKSHNARGVAMRIPTQKVTLRFWDMLATYLQSIKRVLEELKPLAEKVAVDNTVVVMVCNHGQSELLMNFVCNAHARGLDTSQVLLFATDLETKHLAEGLGLTAFYDDTNFGAMSSEAAKRYGDKQFMGMMMAKLYCVQMVSMLGYDFLFQDVDVVWFKNPLTFFRNETSPFHQFDISFQDDGARASRYAPYSPNSGFYFVRHNERTEYFLSVFLRMGDMIVTSGSHQSALNQILSEHVSQRGLRVKVFQRDEDEFPGGYQFNMRSGTWMKDLFAGKKDPIIFHMSWTDNKANKIKFLQQIDEWFVNDKCIGSTAEKIMGRNNVTDGNLLESCCLAKPNFICHYSDKPSKRSCKDSPMLDKGKRPSFW